MVAAKREVIDDFLAQRRMAFVGISRTPSDFSRKLWSELRARGYEIVPVHPDAAEIDGVPCFKRVSDVQPPPAAVLLLTSPAVTGTIVRDCAAAGVRRVWMYRAAGQGSVSEEALQFCREQGISVVPGECPFMFLDGAGLIHSIHGWVRKLTGSYPANQA